MVIFLDIFVFMIFYLNNFIKITVLIFMMSFGYLVSSQEQNITGLFDLEVKKKANYYKSYPNFKKSAFFFIKNEWDSTLVYTTKYLNTSVNDNVALNYCHYFRGFSFIEKELFVEAKKEFNSISPEFEFYFLVKKRLGEIALENSEFKRAISYLEPLTALQEKQYAYLDKDAVYQNLGLCYLHLKEYKKAELYLVENVKINEQIKDTLGLITAYNSVANLYYEQYKDDLAIPYFKKAYQLSKKMKDFGKKQLTSENMAVVEENRKNYKKALAYRKEYEQWKDSLNDQNKIYEVAQIEKEFAVKEKQKEVDLLAAENRAKQIQRNGLLYSALTLLVLLGVMFYFYKEKTKANKIIVAQKERLDELNATKDKLFSIVSHDLRSSVNALKTSHTKLLDNVEAKNLDALTGLVQNNSNIVNGAYNLLDNLLNWALLQTKQSYFEVESLRLFFITEQVAYNYKPLIADKDLKFKNTVSKSDVVYADQESLKIILRNLLDNAIKFCNTGDAIHIYTENNNEVYCNLIIEDSGIGMSASKREELLQEKIVLSKKENETIIGTGLGMQLCKALIARNSGELSIESELGKGTKMIVSLQKTPGNA